MSLDWVRQSSDLHNDSVENRMWCPHAGRFAVKIHQPRNRVSTQAKHNLLINPATAWGGHLIGDAGSHQSSSSGAL